MSVGKCVVQPQTMGAVFVDANPTHTGESRQASGTTTRHDVQHHRLDLTVREHLHVHEGEGTADAVDRTFEALPRRVGSRTLVLGEAPRRIW